MDIPENSKVQEVSQKLAKILRIQDWDITVHVVTGYEINQIMGNCEDDGASCRDVRLNTADIYLNREKDADWYETLVHELIHVQTTPFLNCTIAQLEERTDYFDDLYESLVEKQAQVFCKILPCEKLLTSFKGV